MHAAVVGAGISGIAASAVLVSKGWSVTLLEQEKGPNQRLSFAPGLLQGRAVALLRSLGQTPGVPFEDTFSSRLQNRRFLKALKAVNNKAVENKKVTEDFFKFSCSMHKSTLERFGIDDERIDGLWVLLGEREERKLSEPPEGVDVLSRLEALEREPALSEEAPFSAALFMPDAGSSNGTYLSRRLLEQLLTAEDGRFAFRPGSRVTEILQKGGRVAGVRLEKGGELPCDALVLANALGAAELLKPLGLELPAAGLTGVTFTAEVQNEECLPACSIAFPSSPFVLCRTDSRIRACGRFFLGTQTEKEKKAECNRLYDSVLGSLVNIRLVPESVRFWSAEADALPDGLPAAGTTRALEGLALSVAHADGGLSGAWGAAAICGAALSGDSGGSPAAEALRKACSPDRFEN